MNKPTLRLISSMATKAVLAELLAAYEASTGQAVQCESVGGVDAAKRVRAGEAFDAVVLASNAINELLIAGCLVPDSKVDLVHSGVAVAVRAGAMRPDISSAEAVKQAVLAAASVSLSTGPSGVALAKLFERWGIAQEIAPRMVQAPPGVPVGSLVASGQVALGFQQLSELLHLPGIEVLGPLPADIQITTTFSAAVCSTSQRGDEVQALLHYLTSDLATAAKQRHGMEAA